MNAASCLIRNSGRPRKGRPLYIRLLSARDFLTAPRSISCWIGTETTLGDPHAVGSRISPNGVARICVITVLMTAATRPSQSNTGATSHSFVVGMSAFGSKADILRCGSDVRFTPRSGHQSRLSECPLSANSGHRLSNSGASFFGLCGALFSHFAERSAGTSGFVPEAALPAIHSLTSSAR